MTDTLSIDIQRTKQSKLATIDWTKLPFGTLFTDHMFIANYHQGAWKNFKIVPYGPISISPAAPVLHYGQGIFEGLKAIRNEANEILVFRPHDNARRLSVSAERLCLAPVPESVFMEGLQTLLDLDRNWVPTAEGNSLYIRPFLFSTDEFLGIRPPEQFTFMFILSPVGSYYNEPLRVHVETHYTRAPKGGTGYAKAGGNYAGSLFPAQLAQQKGYHQLLWTDAKEHRYIEESGTMNVMFVKEDTLITPALSDSILAGITRDSLLTLARSWGMRVEERNIEVTEILEGIKNGTVTEAFGVGTAVTIAPIGVIGNGDVEYTLPAQNTWKYAPKFSSTMDAIKRGQAPDEFGWIVKI